MGSIVTVSGSKITLNGRALTVLNQHKLTGAYAKELSAHGCGPCCAAMALTLMGRKTAPADILKKAVSLWGKWPKYSLVSAQGLTAIVKKLGYTATFHAVTKSNRATIRKLIDAALKAGKPVICWTAKGFSSGDHYVLAVGYNKLGRVVVANSGNRGPVNIITLESLCKYLQVGTGKDKGWYKSTAGSAGIVIVGPKPVAKKVTVKKPTIKKVAVRKPAPTYALSTLKRGASGQQVKALQKLLGGLVVGGAFGAKTEAKVIAYQKKHKLTADGVVGPKTWDSLLK